MGEKEYLSHSIVGELKAKTQQELRTWLEEGWGQTSGVMMFVTMRKWSAVGDAVRRETRDSGVEGVYGHLCTWGGAVPWRQEGEGQGDAPSGGTEGRPVARRSVRWGPATKLRGYEQSKAGQGRGAAEIWILCSGCRKTTVRSSEFWVNWQCLKPNIVEDWWRNEFCLKNKLAMYNLRPSN